MSLKLFLPRRAYVRNKPRIGSLIMLVVAPSFTQAEVAVDGSADHVCVAVILPIILPPADLAELLGLRHG
jgi:hypothetical protein